MFHMGAIFFAWGALFFYMDKLCCFACVHCASCGCIMCHMGASFHIVHYIYYGYVILQWVHYVCMFALSFTWVN